jgi:eukaryotic-like serine/threonine-protein kinase
MLGTGLEIANRFRLTRRLGGSDVAPVWLAAERDHTQPVVLKFRPHAAAAALDVVGGLQHPGLATPIAQMRDGLHDIEVFNFAVQGDLGASRGRACAAWLPQVRQLAGALDYLHARGLVHGDLKTANVLIDGGGHALLADLDTLKPVGTARVSTDSYSPFTASPQQRAGDTVQIADDIYAFGALLYELLCAHPPGYTHNGTAAPATGQARVEVLPVQPAPATLLELTSRCLASEVTERPPSMQQIAAELEALEPGSLGAGNKPPILTPPDSAPNRIQSRWQRGDKVPAPDPGQLRSQGFRQGLLVAAVVALAAVALLLFIWPTGRPVQPAAKVPQPAKAASAPGSPPGATPEAPPDLEALARAKTEAEARRNALAPRIAAMANADAMSWNPSALRASQAALAEIDTLMTQHEYVIASRRLEALATQVATLEAGHKPALQAALQRGQAALQQHNSADASAAYAQALKIAADNRDAQRGARRAASLDTVVAELARASTLEQAGQLTAAAAAYRRVLALDPDTSAAQSGLARLQSQLAADQFGQALARGYAALGAGQTVAAHSAFDAAHALRPNDPEVARALQQVAAAEQDAQLRTAMANARQAENNEQWQEATKHYQQALTLDGTLVDARRSLANATARAQLDRELQLLVAQPERAYSDAVHDAGMASLQRAQAIINPGPVLQRQTAAVATLLRKAEQPVSVVLRSDGQTSVTVYKVAELGTFAERSLQLKPGRYIVAGVRSGFRDVRRELNVLPDRELSPLTVQCTEPL